MSLPKFDENDVFCPVKKLEFAIFDTDPDDPNKIKSDHIVGIYSEKEFIAFARDVYEDEEDMQAWFRYATFDNTLDFALQVFTGYSNYEVITGLNLREKYHLDIA